MRPLIYLEIRQLINGIKSVTRSPKRLIPTVIILVWVGAALIGRILRLDPTVIVAIIVAVNAIICVCAGFILGFMYSRFDPTSE